MTDEIKNFKRSPAVLSGVAASMLKVSRMQAWRLVKAGKLKTKVVDGASLVLISSILKYRSRQMQRRQQRKKPSKTPAAMAL